MKATDMVKLARGGCFMAHDLGGWEYTSCPYWDVRTTVPG